MRRIFDRRPLLYLLVLISVTSCDGFDLPGTESERDLGAVIHAFPAELAPYLVRVGGGSVTIAWSIPSPEQEIRFLDFTIQNDIGRLNFNARVDAGAGEHIISGIGRSVQRIVDIDVFMIDIDGNRSETIVFQVRPPNINMPVSYIASADELRDIDMVGYYILTNDIELPGAAGPWRPIGNYHRDGLAGAFRGTIDGGGHDIDNLVIDSDESYVGLFSYLQNAKILNLTLRNVRIRGANFTGALAGMAAGSYIENVHVEGSVTGRMRTGGLIGQTLRGEREHNEIHRSSMTGSVTGTEVMGELGGLVGMNWGIIEKSFTRAAVEGQGPTGGLVGYNQGNIDMSYAQEDVLAYGFTGGLVGVNDTNASIYNSYASGAVSGRNAVGGLVGFNAGTILTSYSRGAVTLHTEGGSPRPPNNRLSAFGLGTNFGNGTGGLVGFSGGGWINDSFYDLVGSGQRDQDRGQALFVDDFRNLRGFDNWNFSDTWTLNYEVNDGYPYLQALPVEQDRGEQ